MVHARSRVTEASGLEIVDGKEMSKELLPKIKAIRNDRSETFRVKCEAQVTLTAIISCISCTG